MICLLLLTLGSSEPEETGLSSNFLEEFGTESAEIFGGKVLLNSHGLVSVVGINGAMCRLSSFTSGRDGSQWI